jgi:PmbA protein
VDLPEAAKAALKATLDAGATSADALALEGRETRVEVRKGELESSRESGSRGVGVRAFRDGRAGSAYTTDLSPEGLRRCGRKAAEMSAVAGSDAAAGLPDPAHRSPPVPVEGVDDPEFEGYDPARGIESAKAAEAAAFAADRRITNSYGAAARASRSRAAIAASDGFEGSFRRTRFSLEVGVAAEEEGGALQQDSWETASTVLSRLEDAEAIGREAARRTLRGLGWRKVATQRVPIVLDPECAAAFAAEVAKACCGDFLARSATFLADSLGEAVASPRFTLVDDPSLPGGLGSRPFDMEGAGVSRRAIVEEGVLRRFLFDTYTLRKVAAEAPERAKGGAPGNASRGLGGPTSVGVSNLYVEPGKRTPGEILASVDEGFYVTRFMGFGVNTTTGDFSQGAAGLWIRKGRLDHAVQEVTLAGNLAEMLRGVEEVANDLERRSEIAAPTMRLAPMTVSGS